MLLPLVEARLAEVKMIRASVELLPEIQRVRGDAGSWRPLYNLAAWHGGQDAYKYASLGCLLACYLSQIMSHMHLHSAGTRFAAGV